MITSFEKSDWVNEAPKVTTSFQVRFAFLQHG